MKRLTNKELSKDIPATINYFVNSGYSVFTDDFSTRVRALTPYTYLIKYITNDSLVRNGGLLRYCDNDKYFGLKNGKFNFHVSYDNIKYLFTKKCRAKILVSKGFSDMTSLERFDNLLENKILPERKPAYVKSKVILPEFKPRIGFDLEKFMKEYKE